MPIVMHTFRSLVCCFINLPSRLIHKGRRDTTRNFDKTKFAVRMLRSRWRASRSFPLTPDETTSVVIVTQSWKTLESWRYSRIRKTGLTSRGRVGRHVDILSATPSSKSIPDVDSPSAEREDSRKRSPLSNLVRISSKRGAIVALSWEIR